MVKSFSFRIYQLPEHIRRDQGIEEEWEGFFIGRLEQE